MKQVPYWRTTGARHHCTIQVTLVLRDFALIPLENLHGFSNVCNIFRFNAIWHRRSVIALVDLLDNFQFHTFCHIRFVVTIIICSRLAGSDVTVTRMGFLCYMHAAHLVFCSTALASLTNMSEKRKSASPGAIQVKNRWTKTVLKRNEA
jgi:hypothetical protein